MFSDPPKKIDTIILLLREYIIIYFSSKIDAKHAYQKQKPL